MRIILGSQSEARARVLKKMGYDFEVMVPNIDEKAIRISDPTKLVRFLAIAKADAILSRVWNQKGLLITADQVVVCDGTVLEKPENEDDVRRYFALYRIFPAQTVTSVVVTDIASKVRYHGVDLATIEFQLIPREVLGWYIATGDPYKHAGGFDHEHIIIGPYVRSIEGEGDSISGLSRTMTEGLLRTFMRSK